MGLGPIFSALGAYQQGQAAEDAANYNAQVADINAKNARITANVNEDAQRRKSASELGRLRAGLAENGISLTEGTGADLYNQSDMNAEMDALNIRYGGTVQSVNYQNQAKLDRMNAAAAGTAKWIGAASAYLNGAASYAKGGGAGLTAG